ncbi:NPM protein, partial [Corythaeola cristata]|nr:NPM protein [Corythaeola cristata]
AGAKDELQKKKAEALDYEGKKIKVVLASLKKKMQPTVSLGGFEITPPVVLRLKCGSGPVYVSGQHLVEPESDDEKKNAKIVNTSTKKTASGGGAKTKKIYKKAKLSEEKKKEDEDDEEEKKNDDLEDDEKKIKAPIKKASGKNMQKKKQNGKDSKQKKPASKSKTPDSKKNKSLTPKTPKKTLSLEEIKAKMQASIDKGSSLPKLEPKFANYVKNCFRTEDQKVIQALWQWRQTL